MEKSNNPVIDYNSDHSDIGSEIYSHDESDMVISFTKETSKKKWTNLGYRSYTNIRAIIRIVTDAVDLIKSL
jgi:hypothetical protein